MFGQQILLMIDEWSTQTGEPADIPLKCAMEALGERVALHEPLEQVRTRLAVRVNALAAEALPGPTAVAGVLAMVELALLSTPEVSREARKKWNELCGVLCVRCRRLWDRQQAEQSSPRTQPVHLH